MFIKNYNNICTQIILQSIFNTLIKKYNSRKNFFLTVVNKMNGNSAGTSSNSDVVDSLNQRLTKAEKRLKILTCEINSIKSQLASIRGTPTIGSRQFSTSTSTAAAGIINSDTAVAPKKTRFDFTKEEDYVVVYTDGACENNGRPNAKAGIGVWFGYNHPLNVTEPVNGRATNNTAEIQACLKAVKIAHENVITKLKIKTDSQFVINSMTNWIHRWKMNNWKVATGGDVKNKTDFVLLDAECKKLDNIIWEYVPGHKGYAGNEEADKLARSGALRYVIPI